MSFMLANYQNNEWTKIWDWTKKMFIFFVLFLKARWHFNKYYLMKFLVECLNKYFY